MNTILSHYLQHLTPKFLYELWAAQELLYSEQLVDPGCHLTINEARGYSITHKWWKTAGAKAMPLNVLQNVSAEWSFNFSTADSDNIKMHVILQTCIYCVLESFCVDLCPCYCNFYFLKWISSYFYFYFQATYVTGSHTLLFVPLIHRLGSEKMPYLRFLYQAFSPLTPFSFWQPGINKESCIAVRRLSSVQITSHNFLCSL